MRVNGKAVLVCTTPAREDMLIEPYHREGRVRDLIVEREAKAREERVISAPGS